MQSYLILLNGYAIYELTACNRQDAIEQYIGLLGRPDGELDAVPDNTEGSW